MILYLLLVSDSANENNHFLNNDYRKAINDVIITRNDIISNLVHLLQYQLHLWQVINW